MAGGTQVTVVVNDQHQRKAVYNVLGVLEGQEEPGERNITAQKGPVIA